MDTNLIKHFRSTLPQVKGLLDLMMCFPLSMRGTTMVEIGSAQGESAALFSLFFGKIICVDPAFGVDFDKNTRGRNVVKYAMKSFEAVGLIEEKVNFIYIDAVHSYPSLKQDATLYVPKLLPKGLFGGHDYSSSWPGVVRAVDELFGKPDKVFCDSSWLKWRL